MLRSCFFYFFILILFLPKDHCVEWWPKELAFSLKKKTIQQRKKWAIPDSGYILYSWEQSWFDRTARSVISCGRWSCVCHTVWRNGTYNSFIAVRDCFFITQRLRFSLSAECWVCCVLNEIFCTCTVSEKVCGCGCVCVCVCAGSFWCESSWFSNERATITHYGCRSGCLDKVTYCVAPVGIALPVHPSFNRNSVTVGSRFWHPFGKLSVSTPQNLSNLAIWTNLGKHWKEIAHEGCTLSHYMLYCRNPLFFDELNGQSWMRCHRKAKGAGRKRTQFVLTTASWQCLDSRLWLVAVCQAPWHL